MMKKRMQTLVWGLFTILVLWACPVTPAQTPDQVIDIPSLVGKSPDEVEKAIGKKPSQTYRGPRLQPYFDEYQMYKVGRRLSVYFRQNKAVYFLCLLKREQYSPTPEGALSSVGIDVNGAPPSQSAQMPWQAPADVVFLGKSNEFFWSGAFNGVRWGGIQVRGNENRFNGTGFSKDYWRVKQKYYHVAAYAVDLDVPSNSNPE
jgi:hypothetical protein